MKSTKKMIIVGMFAAVIAVLAQIAFPLPSGVPVTLQTFAVVLTGVVLGARLGTAAAFVYILLGAVGVPVFSGLGGGLGVIVGKTGGFIWGFLFLSLFSGLALLPKRRIFGVFIPMIGLTLCHLMGSVQYSVLSGMNVWQAALLVSVPYLVKDICSVVLAYLIGIKIRGQLFRASFLSLDGKRAAEGQKTL